ncbi:hypothetical protein [Pseudomonas sp. NPDC007930]|uniref:hypothetical protein n=1 Tax=Pseudomonas sp. NPDC007930 TaxID=3364417 RepID=UPI0036EC1088
MQTIKAGAVLFAKDLAGLALFYEQVAGFTTVVRLDDRIVLETDHFQLVLHGLPAVIAQNLQIEQPPLRRDDVAVKLVFPTPSLARVRVLARTLGGGLDEPLEEWQGPYFRACDGFDPEGNVLQWREPLPGNDME